MVGTGYMFSRAWKSFSVSGLNVFPAPGTASCMFVLKVPIGSLRYVIGQMRILCFVHSFCS